MDPQLKKLQREIAAAIAGLSGDQLSWQPPGKWCVSEVLEHLYLTYTGTVKGFQRVAEAQKTLASSPTWKQRLQILIVVNLGYLPRGREAPAVARPRGLPREMVLAEIGPKIAAMDEMIRRCEELLGTRGKLLDHPILGPLTGAEWRKFHLVHGLHHVKQIRHFRRLSGGETKTPQEN